MGTFADDYIKYKTNNNVRMNGEVKFRMRKFNRIGGLSVNALDLSNRANNGLKRNGVDTVTKIVDNWDKLMSMRGIGENSVREIRYAVISTYYDTLTNNEKGVFWHDAVILG